MLAVTPAIQAPDQKGDCSSAGASDTPVFGIFEKFPQRMYLVLGVCPCFGVKCVIYTSVDLHRIPHSPNAYA